MKKVMATMLAAATAATLAELPATYPTGTA